MKLVRFGPSGQERPGVWLEERAPGGAARILDVRGMAFDINDYDEHFFSHGGLERLAALLKEGRPKCVPAEGVRLGPPIARPANIVCLGANYAAHAAEFGSDVPRAPVIFAKAATSLQGPFDPIVLPRGATIVDTEAELAVVLKAEARRVAETRAMEYVAGYTILNDVTDREAQKQDKQWFRAKSADGFCPLGPFLATQDEIRDPHNLRLHATLNGETLQDDSTRSMIFSIPRIIAYISDRMTLRPGDVIATGTPPGIGSARVPPRVLRAGDVVEIGIEGLGCQKAAVIAAS